MKRRRQKELRFESRREMTLNGNQRISELSSVLKIYSFLTPPPPPHLASISYTLVRDGIYES